MHARKTGAGGNILHRLCMYATVNNNNNVGCVMQARCQREKLALLGAIYSDPWTINVVPR